MTDTSALKALRDRVTADRMDLVSAHHIKEATGKHCQVDFLAAHRGSLDAARTLHEALLPSWRLGLRSHENIEGEGWHVWLKSPDYHVEHERSGGEDHAYITGIRVSSDGDILARQLLICILDALIAEKEGTDG
jgi:hypothetical protein